MGTVLDFGEAGSYTIEERLGHGGHGEVYLARQKGPAGFAQPVAIKRLRPEYSGSLPRRERSFEVEARLLSRLHHPNIARVYGFHRYKGSYYLVMEYIKGQTLHALLELARRKGHRFSVSVACAIVVEVAEALHHAHHATDEAGRPLSIVHRDVTPTNILITKEGRVVLLDFGVARSDVEGRTPTTSGSKTIKGKVAYVSPEQAKHLHLDARSDLFSVGSILMELLTGSVLFGWDDLTLYRIAGVTPKRVASLVSRLPPDVSGPLRSLCQKLLARDPAQRFATGREVAMALRHHMHPHGPERIQAEVEMLHALPDAPDADTPEAPALARARAATVRALSKVMRAKRTLAVASVFLFGMLAVASWYSRHDGPDSSALPPLVQEPAVSFRLSPSTPLAPASPVAPPLDGALVGKPDGEGGATVTAGSSDPAPPEHVAPAVVLEQKLARSPPVVAAPPAGKPTDGAAHVSIDSDESRSTVPDQFVVAHNATGQATVQTITPRAIEPSEQTAPVAASQFNDDKRDAREARLKAMLDHLAGVEEKAIMPDYAVATLLVSDRPELTSLVQVSQRRVDRGTRKAKIEVFASRLEGASMVAVIVNLKNPRDAVAWEPVEAHVRIEPHPPGRLGEAVRWGPRIPAAVRSVPARLVPGQWGRIVVVFDKNDVGLDSSPVVITLLRESKWEFEFTLQPSDLLASSMTEGPP